ncbi:MAG: hypothetical protein J6X44_11255 [Thermoguttaceae bacterium]|nr:hypothetical protein [Thermoguttaceae bacterium]
MRAVALEERALLSVSAAEFVALGGCEAQLDLGDDAFVAQERQDAPVATFDCPGCSGLATVLEGAE